MLRTIFVTEKEYIFLKRLFTVLKDAAENSKEHDGLKIDMLLSVPEHIDLIEISKRIISGTH